MKFKSIILILTISVGLTGCTISNVSKFSKAVEKGEYSETMTLYESIKDDSEQMEGVNKYLEKFGDDMLEKYESGEVTFEDTRDELKMLIKEVAGFGIIGNKILDNLVSMHQSEENFKKGKENFEKDMIGQSLKDFIGVKDDGLKKETVKYVIDNKDIIIAEINEYINRFQKKDWTFFDSIEYNADGVIGKIEYGYNDVNRQTYLGGIFEIAPMIQLLHIEDMKKMANANSVTLRFNGSNAPHVFELSQQQIKELRVALTKIGEL